MKDIDKEELRLNKLRTQLSVKRTMLSSLRTMLSYISTACVFVSLAFTYLKIASVNQIDAFFIAMLCVGAFFFAFGLAEYFMSKKQTKEMLKKYNLELEDEDMPHDE